MDDRLLCDKDPACLPPCVNPILEDFEYPACSRQKMRPYTWNHSFLDFYSALQGMTSSVTPRMTVHEKSRLESSGEIKSESQVMIRR